MVKQNVFAGADFAARVKVNEPMAPRTTLDVGGPAAYYFETDNEDEVVEILSQACEYKLPILILGGGSNIVVADSGWPGLVLKYMRHEVTIKNSGDKVLVEASAGLSWDNFVVAMIDRGLGGVECLSGVPGLVGAAPVQNIGCYGQEVSEAIAIVEAIDIKNGAFRQFSKSECGFEYRQSRFKADDGYLITKVIFNLYRTNNGTVRYDEIARALNEQNIDKPTLGDVRRAVLNIRRRKSMVIDPVDPNSRSVGSFFINPIVAGDIAIEVEQASSGLSLPRAMPRWTMAGGLVKLSAAWLIESSRFQRGYVLGRAGISANHILAIVNRGGATADEVLALAGQIRRRVRDIFGITLEPEPIFVGFKKSAAGLLDNTLV